ncbi:MAG: tetratricopeptide repeat protein [Akkermansiaceae bacterium]|nr:tetratricopeptide repeat protein [Akkermansiaceae bacterium]
MNRNFRFSLLFLALATASLSAGDFAEANQRFQAGDFAGAASAYEQILTVEGPRASVCYNLGNSYFRLGKFGPAILAYERARILTPRDPDLMTNLARARKDAAVTDESQLDPRINAVVSELSPDEWSWLLASAALTIGALTMVGGIIRLPLHWTRRAVGLSLFCIALSASALYLRRAESTRGVVISETTAIRISPFEQAESISTLRPGQIIQIGAQQSGFHYVESPSSGPHGWVADRDFSAVIPHQP